MAANLEHLNITVSNPKETTKRLCKLFGWHIRWHGPAMDDGYTYHVGTDLQYIALYAPLNPAPSLGDDVKTIGKLNHIAVTVDNLKDMELKVRALGYEPFNFRQYLDQQNCFYFRDEDGIEFEIIAYD